MHETSLVAALLRQVDELAAQNGGGRVTTICVEIGPLAGVETLLFDEAFRRLQSGSTAADAELFVTAVDLTCCCRSCHAEFSTPEPSFVCPTCNGREVDVTAGDAVVLRSFTLEAPAPATVGP